MILLRAIKPSASKKSVNLFMLFSGKVHVRAQFDLITVKHVFCFVFPVSLSLYHMHQINLNFPSESGSDKTLRVEKVLNKHAERDVEPASVRLSNA